MARFPGEGTKSCLGFAPQKNPHQGIARIVAGFWKMLPFMIFYENGKRSTTSTLIVIFPTNRRLENRRLDPTSAEAAHLLVRWGYLHAIRTALGLAAFLVMCAAAVGVF